MKMKYFGLIFSIFIGYLKTGGGGREERGSLGPPNPAPDPQLHIPNLSFFVKWFFFQMFNQ